MFPHFSVYPARSIPALPFPVLDPQHRPHRDAGRSLTPRKREDCCCGCCWAVAVAAAGAAAGSVAPTRNQRRQPLRASSANPASTPPRPRAAFSTACTHAAAASSNHCTARIAASLAPAAAPALRLVSLAVCRCHLSNSAQGGFVRWRWRCLCRGGVCRCSCVVLQRRIPLCRGAACRGCRGGGRVTGAS